MPVNAYWAYGLSIHADLVCPEFPPHPHPAGDPDVIIQTLGKSGTDAWAGDKGAGVHSELPHRSYEVLPGRFRLDVPGVARYRVEEGKRILIEPFEDSSPEKIRLFLLGSTMGALLYQRGLFPLHGSAVETPWGAMIFVGAQGSGKSTLAAEFHRRGYRLLSDDVCAVERTPQGLQILPALAQIRLCTDAYERLGTPEGARFNVDKFVVPMGEKYCPEPVPLRAIHILSDDDVDLPRFELVRGLDRVRYLLANLYRPQYLKGQQTRQGLLHMAAQIAQGASVAAVNRKRDTTATADVVRFLELAWAECFKASACREKN
jgi:hypothetical protein